MTAREEIHGLMKAVARVATPQKDAPIDAKTPLLVEMAERSDRLIAELDALRAVAAAAELWRLGRGQNPTGTLLGRLEAYIQSDAGAWLRALDRAREAGRNV